MGHFVYKYVLNNEIIYIGKTDCATVDQRLAQHGKPGDNIAKEAWADLKKAKIYYCTLVNNTMCDVVESELIRRYKPKYNKAKMSDWDGLDFVEPKWKKWKPNKYTNKALKPTASHTKDFTIQLCFRYEKRGDWIFPETILWGDMIEPHNSKNYAYIMDFVINPDKPESIKHAVDSIIYCLAEYAQVYIGLGSQLFEIKQELFRIATDHSDDGFINVAQNWEGRYHQGQWLMRWHNSIYEYAHPSVKLKDPNRLLDVQSKVAIDLSDQDLQHIQDTACTAIQARKRLIVPTIPTGAITKRFQKLYVGTLAIVCTGSIYYFVKFNGHTFEYETVYPYDIDKTVFDTQTDGYVMTQKEQMEALNYWSSLDQVPWCYEDELDSLLPTLAHATNIGTIHDECKYSGICTTYWLRICENVVCITQQKSDPHIPRWDPQYQFPEQYCINPNEHEELPILEFATA